VSGFTLSYASNAVILTILHDPCLLPAQLCYKIINIWKIDSRVKITDHTVLQALPFEEEGDYRKFPCEQA
jgi:hypothetical protein